MRSLEEVPEVWGSIGRSEEKLKLGLKRVTCHRKIAGNWIQNGRRGKKIDVRTGKNVGEPSKKCPKSDLKRGKTRKKWTSQGKKRERALEKSPELGPKTGKSGKNGDFGAKKMGWGSGEKNGLYCRFCNAMRWQNGLK